eukprot:GILJ01008816.1.p1 GENE.GILJ01008816.1~~GILJ01008816.1.p1  ORF type:complete len:254 (+),score=18.31 GILJ01008816.1:82-843(+)
MMGVVQAWLESWLQQQISSNQPESAERKTTITHNLIHDVLLVQLVSKESLLPERRLTIDAEGFIQMFVSTSTEVPRAGRWVKRLTFPLIRQQVCEVFSFFKDAQICYGIHDPDVVQQVVFDTHRLSDINGGREHSMTLQDMRFADPSISTSIKSRFCQQLISPNSNDLHRCDNCYTYWRNSVKGIFGRVKKRKGNNEDSKENRLKFCPRRYLTPSEKREKSSTSGEANLREREGMETVMQRRNCKNVLSALDP